MTGNRAAARHRINAIKAGVLGMGPLLTILAYFFAGPIAMVLMGVLIVGLTLASALHRPQTHDAIYSPLGAVDRSYFMNKLAQSFEIRADTGQSAICAALQIDDYSGMVDRHGSVAADQVMGEVVERIRALLRQSDLITQLDTNRFAVLLSPKFRMNLETGLQLAARLQKAIEQPYVVDGIAVYCSASVGFTLQNRIPTDTADCFLDCAEIALKDARRNGPAGLRAYSDRIAASILAEQSLTLEVASAFERGEISAWFQPQVSTDTGLVSGFEALARWRHPEKGMVPPSEFLPAMQDAGMMEALSETMLSGALAAIKKWDQAGIHVPSVGVNFSSNELRNPKLVDRVSWELDRHDLEPSRLSVEILETVVAGQDDDTIVANITKLNALGCGIDLDDFGTGHASIAAIKRFAIHRLKIDRSFVSRIDEDAKQQTMLTAILSMAEQLDLETLAEGVETLGEHAMLCQLGCQHVQGFGLARPMPLEETIEWMTAHQGKIETTKDLRQRFG